MTSKAAQHPRHVAALLALNPFPSTEMRRLTLLAVAALLLAAACSGAAAARELLRGVAPGGAAAEATMPPHSRSILQDGAAHFTGATQFIVVLWAVASALPA